MLVPYSGLGPDAAKLPGNNNLAWIATGILQPGEVSNCDGTKLTKEMRIDLPIKSSKTCNSVELAH
jgi:hypothetical protein